MSDLLQQLSPASRIRVLVFGKERGRWMLRPCGEKYLGGSAVLVLRLWVMVALKGHVRAKVALGCDVGGSTVASHSSSQRLTGPAPQLQSYLLHS